MGGIPQGIALAFHVRVYGFPGQGLTGGHDVGLETSLAIPAPPRCVMGTDGTHVVVGVAEDRDLVRVVIALPAAETPAENVVRGQ